MIERKPQKILQTKIATSDLRESWLTHLEAIKAKEVGGDQHKYYNNLIL